MPDLKDGEIFEMQGSGKKPYQLKNVGGVYSCSCPAWRNQSLPIERRTCKHLRKLRGDAVEEARIGSALAPVRQPKEGVIKPSLLLAEVWDRVLDPTGYWMSEKLDGVRALWNAKNREFITRNGNIYLAPDWFTKGLPDENLDGELWMGRKMFQRTVSVVRRQDKSDDWKNVRYLVFDAPNVKGVFEARRDAALSLLNGHAFYAFWHEHTVCRGINHVEVELARVEALGAEGLMLRAPNSLYDGNRSMTLLKVKSFKDDEAVVTGYQAGKGKHKGKMGAIEARMENGTEFEIGTGFTDADRANPPPIGAVVKFKYQELTDDGKPRFPVYLGEREE
jgi:DNA ligase-1